VHSAVVDSQFPLVLFAEVFGHEVELARVRDLVRGAFNDDEVHVVAGHN
jgi:hypothetical protein